MLLFQFKKNLQPLLVIVVKYNIVFFLLNRLYGLMAWCPEYLKLLKATEYEARANHYVNETHNGKTFNGSLENLQYKDSKFVNCK